jgi:Protein of unknown function (DUF1214)
VSVMVINQDHYINRVLHQPGVHELTVDEFDTPYVLVGARTLVDPADPADVAEVNRLQDQFQLQAASGSTFTAPEYDQSSLDATRTALLELAKGIGSLANAFGAKQVVNPVRHLIASAAGWGGLPDQEASYVNVNPGLPVGEYQLTVPADVPVDGFWSISLYNADGYFVPNDRDAVSVNNLTATPNPDGTVSVHFGGCDDNRPNCLPIMDGWNYLVRLYRPRPEVLGGTWTPPSQSSEPTRSSDPVKTRRRPAAEARRTGACPSASQALRRAAAGSEMRAAWRARHQAEAIHPDHLERVNGTRISVS